ncbi:MULTISPECIES: MBL fold metallo-hydrolase [Alphaproteobacteria]|uniref:Membrane protein n=2 Tax=Alphaproteobacteria TaxID=28211 RepID=A0A512HKA0_9HYPH|nr:MULTISPECIES: MBL fold metallo-hydrolase [Alphaproteobacteria]GEO85873.1 membrane protein [Ciceribacter naphthalenivorans]GLR21729.1 membrane protein [Ciceribacter naphthalenivorans]GLT04585.1 membrane protein [Sphingomonas psychrolutea]
MSAKPANPYYTGPVSDHFDGKRFFNPEGVEPGGVRDLIKWRTNGQRARWPKRVNHATGPASPKDRIGGEDLRVTMVGHATLLIQVAGLNILTDPVWSKRVSPFSFAGPKRVIEPGIAFDDLPPIDIVLVTHNHYDHLDLATLARLEAEHAPHIITPLGNDTIIHRALPDAKISAVDWGDRLDYWDDVTIDAEPCHHWSARGLRDRRMALWAAFVITTPAGKIYHIGDTGFHDGVNYRAAAEKHGSFRLAGLPIGAYEPRWFMKGQHQNPAEAVAGFGLCKASHAVGHHFGTFQLTDEAIEAPVADLAEALSAARIDPGRFRPLRPGEAFDVPE